MATTEVEYERYEGGSAEAELAVFARLADRIMRAQLRNRTPRGAPRPDRAFHAKTVLGVENARLEVSDDLPADLVAGPFRPGATFPVTVRFSNAGPVPAADTVGDAHGIALRLHTGPETVQDLLLTDFPVSPAANAHEFVAIATATAGRSSRTAKLLSLVLRLPWRFGLAATRRIVTNLRASARVVDSLATTSFYSRGAILWGDAGPVRYLVRPVDPPARAPASGPDRLRFDLADRLAEGDVVFGLAVQRWVSEAVTPVEDTSRGWEVAETVVARLTVPGQDVDTATARAVEHRVDRTAFNPWNTDEAFRPLGHLNRARRAAYEASSALRHGERFVTVPARREVVIGAVLAGVFGALNRRVPWHRLPTPLALLNLTVLRHRLRRENLIDTDRSPGRVEVRRPDAPIPPEHRWGRTDDGSDNDLSAPGMGAAGAGFGRNMPPVPDQPEGPDPVRVADVLLGRDRFRPARSLNLLAAAWIQMQVHDWVVHGRYPVGDRAVELPMPDGRTWQNTAGGPRERVMRLGDDRPELGNTVSHWWDGSEVYGSGEQTVPLEADGVGPRLCLPNGHLPRAPGGVPLSGFAQNWWLGLGLLQTLFALEHNAICDALVDEYPGMAPAQVHRTARLVVAALLAKIHTVEWTPAILATTAVDVALNVNWHGAPSDWLSRAGLAVVDPHALHGIPGTDPDHHGVPYSLTEEFVTVYRMHPLIPDDYALLDHRTGAVRETADFADVAGPVAQDVLERIGLTDTAYSFGVAHPGAVTLRNFPRALRRFERQGTGPDAREIVDLAVADVVRTRRRGVPRYNCFREALHMGRLRSFSELTDDPELLAGLAEVYDSIDDVDTVVGLLAENPPEGFGFSDTAFRIFLLMASRRLQSDRFLTVDYRPEIYTPLGMDWIARGGMATVLLRHCPELGGVVTAGKSVFAPWS